MTSSTETLTAETLDALLRSLDVRLHTFASCEVGADHRLVFGPMDTVVVHYVLAGAGLLDAPGSDPVPIRAGNIVVVPVGLGHSVSASASAGVDVRAADASLALTDGLVKITAGPGPGELLTICGAIEARVGSGARLFDRGGACLVEDVSGCPAFGAAFAQLADEIAHPTLITRPLTEAIMKQCLLLLIRAHVGSRGDSTPFVAALRDPRLGPAVTAMLVHPGDRHTLAGLAGACGMSRSAFAKRFSAVHGRTPFDFLLQTRQRQAAHLLEVTDLPVKVIARAVGYDSRSHFSRAFRRSHGADPSQYRNRRRESGAATGGPP